MRVLNIQTWTDMFDPSEINADKIQEYLDFIKESEDHTDPERYSEWHHVIPKCIDECNVFGNEVIKVNYADHFRAHMKLVECFKGDKRRKLGYVLHLMKGKRTSYKDLAEVTPEELEYARHLHKEAITGAKRSKETRDKLSKTLGDGRLKGEKHPRYGKHHTEETKRRISQANTGNKWSESSRQRRSMSIQSENNPNYGKHPVVSDETRKRISESSKNKIWINNGETSTKLNSSQKIPDGWVRGRLSFSRSTNGQEGRMWINNGVINKKILRNSELPEGFVEGRSKKSHED